MILQTTFYLRFSYIYFTFFYTFILTFIHAEKHNNNTELL